MISTIYIEEEVRHHPRSLEICARFPKARTIICERFSEVFNRKCQNFRLQKQKPSLILAKKYGPCLHPLPEDHRVGNYKSFYFSTLYNCPFDCIYCFLQGFFRSAHFLLFVNFEDFFRAIEEEIEREKKEQLFFFSGYESDHLATETFSSFLKEFLPFFEKKKESLFEIRTKSSLIAPLLQRKPIENCIVAFSLNPSLIVKTLEKKSSSLEARIQSLVLLQQRGWKIALRFDPILFFEHYEEHYQRLFQTLFAAIDATKVHSATVGLLRYPKEVYKNMRQALLSSWLLSPLFEQEQEIFTYTQEIQKKVFSFCLENLLSFLPREKIFLQEKS